MINRLELGNMVVYHIEPFNDPGQAPEDAFLGRIVLFGVPHHFQAIRVRTDRPDGCIEPDSDPEGRFADMQRFYSGAYSTVKLPGLEGEYVVMVYPYAD